MNWPYRVMLTTPPHHVFNPPPGHFYSPICDLNDIAARAETIFKPTQRALPGLDLREKAQLDLLETFVPFYDECPFEDAPLEGLRYGFDNQAYGYADALFLYFMMRHAKPKRIIEVGCGHSSCLMLDVNDLFFDGSIRIEHIEPFPELLLKLVRPTDVDRLTIVKTGLQDVPLDTFKSLKPNDILFIDSTHVSKTGSDVNYIFGEILPALKKGVYIHFHDIFSTFEYPQEWLESGVNWNEAYMLKAFLQYNNAFQIVAFNTFLETLHEDFFAEKMPLCLRNKGGSIWLRKVK